MKKLTFTILSLVALLMFATAVVWAAPPGQEGPKLVPEISWEKDAVYPGADVKVDITLKNEGAAPVPEGTEVKVCIEIRTIGDEPETKRKSDEVEIPNVVGLKPEGTVKAPPVEIVAPPEDNYNLVAILTVNGKLTEYSESFPVQSALPPGLARLFAGLGMFAAVMAIMAVGTEVVVDSFKFLLGMKQKITALEALDQLKEELPGQLADLGVDAKSLQEVNKIIKDIKVTLQPVQIVAKIPQQIKDGDFGDAIAAIDKIKGLDTAMGEANEELENLKEAARAGVRKGFSALREALPISRELAGQIEGNLINMINDITDVKDAASKAEELRKWLFGNEALGQIQKALQNPQIVQDWVQSQVDTFLTQGRKGVMDLLKENVIPTLHGLGFQKGTVDDMKGELVKALDVVERTTRLKTTTYTSAVKSLLKQVEERRNVTQSPVRKMYRRLRNSHLPISAAVGVVVAVVVLIACIVAVYLFGGDAIGGLGKSASPLVAGLVKFGVALGVFVVALMVGLVIGLVAWIVMAVVAGVLLWLAKGRSGKVIDEVSAQMPLLKLIQGKQQNPQKEEVSVADDGKKQPPVGSLGYALRCWIEWLFNWLLGRDTQTPEKYGEVDEKVTNQIKEMGPTTVAAVLLEREDKHRDEETSRIRMLRIISFFVGAVLAYLLQIDALRILEQALPGATKFNFPIITGVRLHALWQVLPEDVNCTAGIILTGLAASAGSKFWRDLLGRLQATKKQAESVAVMVRKAKSTIGIEEGQ